MSEVDVLAIGAHPDDIELIIGGTVAKLAARGKHIVIMDLTKGEMGTRGTPETRAAESAAAARIIGASDRLNLDLGDGKLENSRANQTILIEQIRRLKPKLIMTHHWEDLHPDHCAAGEILKSIMYPLGFAKYPAHGAPYRPNEVLFFMAHFPFEPSFIVDVSGYFELKLKAAQCYRSQLFDPDSAETMTNISQPDFLMKIEARGRYFGSLIYRDFGEPFFARRPIPIVDPVDLYEPFPKI